MQRINWNVYIHKSPSGKVYVGITSKKPTYRWNKGKGYINQVFYNAILKYGWDNIEHKILFENLSKQDAKLIEEDLIYYYKKLGLSYNVTDGGESATGIVHRGPRNPFYGKHHTDDARKRISDSLKGKSFNNGSNNGMWKKPAPNRRSVIQYNIDGDIICKWECIAIAGKELNINRHSIGQCCRGTLKTAGGFIWKYE